MLMKLSNWVRNKKGQSSIEYVLIIALIVLALVSVYATFKDKINSAFTTVGDNLNKAVGTTPQQ